MDPLDPWYFIWKVLDVLAARGYEITDDHREALEDITIDGESQATLEFDDYDYVIRYYSSKFNKEDVNKLESLVNEPDTVIFIIADLMTSTGESSLVDLVKAVRTNAQVEVWLTSQLLVNPLTHAYSPKYKILTKEEKQEEIPILRRDPNFTKRLEGFSNDIVIKWLGGKVGDIVRIERQNDILKSMITDYRIVRSVKLITKFTDKD